MLSPGPDSLTSLPRGQGLVWRGGDLRSTLAQAFPKAPQRWHSADADYATLVDLAHPVPGAVLVWTDVVGLRDAARIRWAMAEAGWKGRFVLAEPQADGGGWTVKRGSTKAVDEALARPGAPLPDADTLLRWADKPRAVSLPRSAPNDPGAALLLGGVLRAAPGFDGWATLARWALQLGHPDAALHWSRRAAREVQKDAQFAELLGLQGRIHGVLGDLPRAARELRDAEGRADGEAKLWNRAARARVLREQGNPDALAALTDAHDALLRHFETDRHRGVVRAALTCAEALLEAGRTDEARPLVARAGAVLEIILGGPLDPIAAEQRRVQAWIKQVDRDLAGARDDLDEAERILVSTRGDTHPALATVLHQRGGLEHAAGDLDSAEAALQEALAIQGLLLPEAHPGTAATLHQLAAVLQARGDLAGARDHLEGVLAIEEQVHGGRDHPSTAVTELSLGVVLMRLGEREAGLQALEHAAEVLVAAHGPDHPHAMHAAKLLAAAQPTEEPDEPDVVTPFLLAAVAAAGRSLPRDLLAELTFRVLLRERAAPILSVLTAADLAAAEPGVLSRDPAALKPPPELAARLQVPWERVLDPVLELHRQMVEGLDRLLPATDRVDPEALGDLRAVDDTERLALIDLALAAAARARKTGDRAPLLAELPLWIDAGAVAIRLDAPGLGTTLPRMLLAALPEHRGPLLAAWAPLLDDDHADRLGG